MSKMSKCDSLPFEDVEVTTNWIYCSGTHGVGAVCKEWLTLDKLKSRGFWVGTRKQ